MFEDVRADIDRGDEAVGDAVLPRVSDQRVDRILPVGLSHFRVDTLVGDDAGVMFRQ